MSFAPDNKGGSFREPSFQRLLTCLGEIRHKLDSREDDFLFLSNYFQNQDFWKLFKVHDSLSHSGHDGKAEVPNDPGISCTATASESAVELAKEVVEVLLPNSLVDEEVQELQHILTKPHVKGLFQAHDFISAGDFASNTSEEEVSYAILTDLNETPEEVENKDITSERNSVEEESDHTFDEDDTDVGDDDIDGDEGNGDDNDQGEIAEKTEQEEVHESRDESANENDDPHFSSSQSSPLLPDNRHVMVPEVIVHVNEVYAESLSEENPWWDMPADDEKEPVLPASGNDIPVSGSQSAKKVKRVRLVTNSDIEEEEDRTDDRNGHYWANDKRDNNKEIDTKVKPKEKDKGDNSREHNAKDGQKIGVPVARNENAVKTIRLFRSAKETLGITVKAARKSEDSVRIIVARILKGGLADTFGSLCVDDEILEINGKRVEGMTANEVAEMMDGMIGSVDMKIVPHGRDQILSRETKVSIRAFFDYNPLQDPLIPCKEVGVAFCSGDVLHVVNMDDAKWWQARKDGCGHDKAGLIPSKDFQEKRQQFNKISSSSKVNVQKHKNGRRVLPFWRKRTNGSNKILCNFLQDVKVDSWPAYEAVGKYLETAQTKRLLLLIGAPGVGRNELKRMLLFNSPDKFNTTVPHTTRHMRSYEKDGRDYFFVSRQTMENFIQKKKFIEFGEYKGCLYGTSKDSIKRALKTGKTCVLKVQPEVMLLLRTAEFKPYCIYIKPPTLKELRTSRLTVQGKATSGSNRSYMRAFKEEDLQLMIDASRELEDNFGKFFDLTVVNKDVEDACNSIVDAVERLEQEEQWVPLDWAQKT